MLLRRTVSVLATAFCVASWWRCSAAACHRSLLRQQCTFRSCPEMHDYTSAHGRALDSGNYVVYRPVASVGNMLYALYDVYEMSRRLNLALIIDPRSFLPFAFIFEPHHFNYNNASLAAIFDQNDTQTLTQQTNSRSMFRFSDGYVVTEQVMDRQPEQSFTEHTSLRSLASQIVESRPPHMFRCFFTGAFRISRGADAMLEHSRLGLQDRYTAWHIRTSFGESEMYNVSLPEFQYIVSDHPMAVCRAFVQAHVENVPEKYRSVFLSTNDDRVMAHCRTEAQRYNLTIIATEKAHIGLVSSPSLHTENVPAAQSASVGILALLDWISIVNARYIISTGSSFSESAKMVRGISCSKAGETSTNTPIQFCS